MIRIMSSERWQIRPDTISPRALHRLSQDLGIRDPKKLLLLVYGDEQYSREFSLNERDIQSAEAVDVTIYGDLDTVSEETKQLSHELHLFCQLAAWRFQQQFLKQIDQLQRNKVTLPTQMIQTLNSPEEAL